MYDRLRQLLVDAVIRRYRKTAGVLGFNIAGKSCGFNSCKKLKPPDQRRIGDGVLVTFASCPYYADPISFGLLLDFKE